MFFLKVQNESLKNHCLKLQNSLNQQKCILKKNRHTISPFHQFSLPPPTHPPDFSFPPTPKKEGIKNPPWILPAGIIPVDTGCGCTKGVGCTIWWFTGFTIMVFPWVPIDGATACGGAKPPVIFQRWDCFSPFSLVESVGKKICWNQTCGKF